MNHQEAIMTTYTGNDMVKGGYYLNVRDWKVEAIDGAVGALPAVEGARYVRVPLLAMLALAPLFGLGFVVVLPFLGLVVLGEEAWGKAAAAVAARREASGKAVGAHR